MKLKELRDLLNSMPLGHDDDNVCVVTKNPSVGFSSGSNVTNAFSGFDWDNGRFMIYCEHPLIKIHWNSFKEERLPKTGEVLWIHDGKSMNEGKLHDNNWVYLENGLVVSMSKFTHWIYKFDFPRPINEK